MPKKGDHTDRQPLGDANDPHGWHLVTEAFFEWMAVTNYSPRTIHNRRNYLTYFIRWAMERGLARPNEVTKATLERYQRYLLHYRKRDGDPLATRGQHSRLTPVRAFFKWTTRQNLTLYNPASELDLPRLEMRLPKHILTEPEAEKVMGTPDLKDPLGVRDRAMLDIVAANRRWCAIRFSCHVSDRSFSCAVAPQVLAILPFRTLQPKVHPLQGMSRPVQTRALNSIFQAAHQSFTPVRNATRPMM